MINFIKRFGKIQKDTVSYKRGVKKCMQVIGKRNKLSFTRKCFLKPCWELRKKLIELKKVNQMSEYYVFEDVTRNGSNGYGKVV